MSELPKLRAQREAREAEKRTWAGALEAPALVPALTAKPPRKKRAKRRGEG